MHGYHIQAHDGELGHVEDLIVDTGEWKIRYLVVDTRNFWPGKKVLLAPDWIREIVWDTQRVQVDLAREAIRQGPEYQPDRLLDREYEEELHTHLGRPGYWEKR